MSTAPDVRRPTLSSVAERLLPTRVVVPVFASDATSPVACAPQEIRLVLPVAGVSAVELTPWIGIAAELVMGVVVASVPWQLTSSVGSEPGERGGLSPSAVRRGRYEGSGQ